MEYVLDLVIHCRMNRNSSGFVHHHKLLIAVHDGRMPVDFLDREAFWIGMYADVGARSEHAIRIDALLVLVHGAERQKSATFFLVQSEMT